MFLFFDICIQASQNDKRGDVIVFCGCALNIHDVVGLLEGVFVSSILLVFHGELSYLRCVYSVYHVSSGLCEDMLCFPGRCRKSL